MPFLPLTIHVTSRLDAITHLRMDWGLFNLLQTAQGCYLTDHSD